MSEQNTKYLLFFKYYTGKKIIIIFIEITYKIY